MCYDINMNIDELKAKQSEVEQAFNKVKGEHLSLEIELHKLQGAWRFVSDLIKGLEPRAATGDTPPDDSPIHVPVESLDTATVDETEPAA
jgi:hypothetical protein